MEDLGLCTVEVVEKISNNSDCIDCVEGCLLDSLLFYNPVHMKYFMCLEHAENEWTSCYHVYAEEGVGSILWDMWNVIKDKMEAE